MGIADCRGLQIAGKARRTSIFALFRPRINRRQGRGFAKGHRLDVGEADPRPFRPTEPFPCPEALPISAAKWSSLRHGGKAKTRPQRGDRRLEGERPPAVDPLGDPHRHAPGRLDDALILRPAALPLPRRQGSPAPRADRCARPSWRRKATCSRPQPCGQRWDRSVLCNGQRQRSASMKSARRRASHPAARRRARSPEGARRTGEAAAGCPPVATIRAKPRVNARPQPGRPALQRHAQAFAPAQRRIPRPREPSRPRRWTTRARRSRKVDELAKGEKGPGR